MICGGTLLYSQTAKPTTCNYCGSEAQTTVTCAAGHFVCDSCHAMGALDLIEKYCTTTREPDPVRQALTVMRNPCVKMHGPEHHFLVPAVLISAWLNAHPSRGERTEMMRQARQRAADLKGGFCGFHGTCGAAMGAGIACSVITGATPLSRNEWRLCNLITAACLTAIANAGGPRCCKRDVFLAIGASVTFLNAHLDAGIPAAEAPLCEFGHLNGECIGEECRFHPASHHPFPQVFSEQP